MTSFLSRLFGRSEATPVEWLEIDELSRRLADGVPVVLIDVRGPDEYSTPPGHLPGAINVPLPELPTRFDEIAADDRPVVLVCKTDRRSAKAADMLLSAGFRNVAVLRGGTDGWHQKGLPLD